MSTRHLSCVYRARLNCLSPRKTAVSEAKPYRRAVKRILTSPSENVLPRDKWWTGGQEVSVSQRQLTQAQRRNATTLRRQASRSTWERWDRTRTRSHAKMTFADATHFHLRKAARLIWHGRRRRGRDEFRGRSPRHALQRRKTTELLSMRNPRTAIPLESSSYRKIHYTGTTPDAPLSRPSGEGRKP